jgi:DNA-binding NarL/FixJ family response regulator
MLLIEDNDDMRYLVHVVMDVSEHDVEVIDEARDGERGLAAWRERRPDVTVLDFRLPGMNGLDVARHILDEDPTAPILLFSAFLDDATIAAAEQLGVRACVSKDQIRELPRLVAEHAAAEGD